jgi:hypothetical protein
VNIFIIYGYGRFIFLFKFNQCDILSVLLSMERFPVYALIAVFYARYIVIYHDQMTFNDTFISNIIFFFHCLKGISESILISYKFYSKLLNFFPTGLDLLLHMAFDFVLFVCCCIVCLFVYFIFISVVNLKCKDTDVNSNIYFPHRV